MHRSYTLVSKLGNQARPRRSGARPLALATGTQAQQPDSIDSRAAVGMVEQLDWMHHTLGQSGTA